MKNNKRNKVKFIQACVQRYFEWKKEGKQPKTRAKALSIISAETGRDLKEIRAACSDFDNDGTEAISDPLAFIVWDLTENDGRAKTIDYDSDRNWFSGVLQQARLLLYTYTRTIVPVRASGGYSAGERVNMPGVVRLPGTKGATPLAEIKPAELEAVVERHLRNTTEEIRRWKYLGADRAFVRRYVERHNAEVMHMFPD